MASMDCIRAEGVVPSNRRRGLGTSPSSLLLNFIRSSACSSGVGSGGGVAGHPPGNSAFRAEWTIVNKDSGEKA